LTAASGPRVETRRPSAAAIHVRQKDARLPFHNAGNEAERHASEAHGGPDKSHKLEGSIQLNAWPGRVGDSYFTRKRLKYMHFLP
jgi:hypothetical protein